MPLEPVILFFMLGLLAGLLRSDLKIPPVLYESLSIFLLLAIGLVRSEESFNFLLAVVRDEGRSTALRALEALAIYAVEERRREQIREAVEAFGDAKVREAFAAMS